MFVLEKAEKTLSPLMRAYLTHASADAKAFYFDLFASLYDGQGQGSTCSNILEQVERTGQLRGLVHKAKGSYALASTLAEKLYPALRASLSEINAHDQANADSFFDDDDDDNDDAQEFEALPFANVVGDRALVEKIEGDQDLKRIIGLNRYLGPEFAEYAINSDLFSDASSSRSIQFLLDYLGANLFSTKAKTPSWSDSGVAPYDVETGNDIARVLPSSIATLGIEELEDLFWSDYAENRLLQYRMRERVKLDSGDFVAFVDVSASMLGQRIERALAMVAAMAAGARERGSAVTIYLWSTGFRKIRFERGFELADLFAEIYAPIQMGGTDPYAAISDYLDCVDSGQIADDILWITDAAFDVSDEVSARYVETLHKKTETVAVLMGVHESSIGAGFRRMSTKIVSTDSFIADVAALK